MTQTDILKMIQENLISILPHLNPDDITPNQSMRDLGANSIDRADILVRTMEQLQLKVPLIEFATLSNIGELVDLFYSKQA